MRVWMPFTSQQVSGMRTLPHLVPEASISVAEKPRARVWPPAGFLFLPAATFHWGKTPAWGPVRGPVSWSRLYKIRRRARKAAPVPFRDYRDNFDAETLAILEIAFNEAWEVILSSGLATEQAAREMPWLS